MPTALDTFRAQREAADGVYARLTDVSQLLHQLRGQADALARNDELHAVLQREQSWLDQAQRTIEEARRWRQVEMQRFWPGVVQRWIVALAFALASAGAAGAGYALVTRSAVADLAALRGRMDFVEFFEHRAEHAHPSAHDRVKRGGSKRLLGRLQLSCSPCIVNLNNRKCRNDDCCCINEAPRPGNPKVNHPDRVVKDCESYECDRFPKPQVNRLSETRRNLDQ